MKPPRWKQGAAHAPAHEVYGAIVADMHGGDWQKYAAWIKTQPDALVAMKTLRDDRAKAWDVLMGMA
jgi:hypothetical protein